MPRFIYKAKKNPKETVEGKIDAADPQDAAGRLRQMGLFPLSVEEETAAKIQSKSFLPFGRGVPLRDLSTFTRQLANLIDSGMPLMRSLDVLSQQTENRAFSRIISDIRADIADGAAFSAAVSKHPRIFSPLFVNMIASGEVGGMLDKVLSRLADFIERDEAALSKVKSSLAYPSLMLIVGSVTIFILLSFVAPRLVEMFVDLGEALPLPTLILMGISGFFARFWWLIVISIAFLYFSLSRWVKTKDGKRIFDRFKLRIPLIGSFIRNSEFSRFGRTLGTLIQNGVPIIKALEVLSNAITNELIKQDVKNSRRSVIDGVSLSVSMSKEKHFPPLMINMIAVGEESGSLEDLLFKIADSYDREVDRMIKVFTTLLEPLLIIFLGVIVGFIVISILLPIFQINLLVR